MKSTSRASEAPNAGSEFLLGTIGHHLDPLDAGSNAVKFRGFSGDTSRASDYSPVVVPNDEVLPASMTRDLPDKPGYDHSYSVYQDGM